ncbi:hypothetical protein F4775DRAFT_572098 [Biscogniauxia sp. FL1348]|nr:hypothetical protein F4775DRAFT_572098 [Biscogniauxia sp. FL1348]
MEALHIKHRQCRINKKRAPYSYSKCTDCRRDKQKCMPENRQWPGQKCVRCENKGFPCSESQRTTARGNIHDSLPTSRSTSQPDPQPGTFLSPSAQTENPLVKECLHGFDWLRLVVKIIRVVEQINRNLRKRVIYRSLTEGGANGSCIHFEPCGTARKYICELENFKYIILRHINSVIVSQGGSSEEIWSLLFRRSVQGMELIASRDSRDAWRFLKNESMPSLTDELDDSGEGLSALDAQIRLMVMQSMFYEENILMREVEKYNRLLKAFWADNRKLYKKMKPEETDSIPSGAMEPFLHDAHFPESGSELTGSSLKRLITTLSSVDNRYVVGQDSLGRTLLHIAVERFVSSDVRLVLQQGIDINTQDIFRRTALHVACNAMGQTYGYHENQLVIIYILLDEQELDIQAVDRYGFLAIDYAIQDRHIAVLRRFQKSRHYKPDSYIGRLIDASIRKFSA